jgi:aminopeptidase
LKSFHKYYLSKSNILFYETLYDENASCHLALGDGFPDCLEGKDLEKLGYNESETHVDFMIGTDDLNIIAETPKGEIYIMKNGKFVI